MRVQQQEDVGRAHVWSIHWRQSVAPAICSLTRISSAWSDSSASRASFRLAARSRYLLLWLTKIFTRMPPPGGPAVHPHHGDDIPGPQPQFSTRGTAAVNAAAAPRVGQPVDVLRRWLADSAGGWARVWKITAVALGQLHQRGHLFVRRVGVQIEAQADVAEAHRRILGHAQRAPAVDVALGMHRGIPQGDAQRGGHCLHRDAGTGHQRLHQHVARAGFHAGATGHRVQAGGDIAARCAQPAGDALAQLASARTVEHRRSRVCSR